MSGASKTTALQRAVLWALGMLERYRYIKFGIVGASGTVVNLSMLHIGHEYIFNNIEAAYNKPYISLAVAISLAGGAVGVVLGLVASYLISSTLRWATVVSPGSVLIAFGVSAAVGVLFGWYPARRAAELDPIDALRHE